MKKIFLNAVVSAVFITLSVLSFAQWKPDYKNHVAGANAVQRAKDVRNYLKQEYDIAVKKYVDAIGNSFQIVLNPFQAKDMSMDNALADKKAIEDEMDNGLGKYAAAVLSSYTAYQNADTDREAAQKNVDEANRDLDNMRPVLMAAYQTLDGGRAADMVQKNFDKCKVRMQEAKSLLADTDKNLRKERYDTAVADFNKELQKRGIAA